MDKHLASRVLLSLVVTLFLGMLVSTGCSGGGNDRTDNTQQQGTGALPGQQQGQDNTGEGGNGTGPGSGTGSTGGSGSGAAWGGGFYQASPIQSTVGGSAPLGTEPAYQVTELSGTTTRESSRVTSVTVGEIELTFAAIDAVMVPDGETPDWDVEHATFDEGQVIDIYFKYELDPNFALNRSWTAVDIGLEYMEPNVAHAENGTYITKLDYIIPWGTQVVNGELWTGVSFGGENDVIDEPFLYDVINTTTTYRAEYPTVNNYVDNGGAYRCLPFCSATFYGTAVLCTSSKDLGTVVLNFEDGVHQAWDGLSGYSGTFYGTGDNEGKRIVGVWIKSGCNFSGDGPGYGEYFEDPGIDGAGNYTVSLGQMAFEDLAGGNDYDYNDFVGYINAIETRDENGNLLQIHFTLQAGARSTSIDSDWQFNLNGAFPGATAITTVDQFYDSSDERHGNQRIYGSQNGASIPVFTPIRDALPIPVDHAWSTNGFNGTTFVAGDYAKVTVVFESPVAAGTYADAPYDPELRVAAGDGSVYCIGLWKDRHDYDLLDANGRPPAFIVPYTYAWPLEGTRIETAYPGFEDWLFWINMHANGNEPDPAWWTEDPVAGYFDRNNFLPYPTP